VHTHGWRSFCSSRASTVCGTLSADWITLTATAVSSQRPRKTLPKPPLPMSEHTAISAGAMCGTSPPLCGMWPTEIAEIASRGVPTNGAASSAIPTRKSARGTGAGAAAGADADAAGMSSAALRACMAARRVYFRRQRVAVRRAQSARSASAEAAAATAPVDGDALTEPEAGAHPGSCR